MHIDVDSGPFRELLKATRPMTQDQGITKDADQLTGQPLHPDAIARAAQLAKMLGDHKDADHADGNENSA